MGTKKLPVSWETAVCRRVTAETPQAREETPLIKRAHVGRWWDLSYQATARRNTTEILHKEYSSQSFKQNTKVKDSIPVWGEEARNFLQTTCGAKHAGYKENRERCALPVSSVIRKSHLRAAWEELSKTPQGSMFPHDWPWTRLWAQAAAARLYKTEISGRVRSSVVQHLSGKHEVLGLILSTKNKYSNT